MIFQFSDGGLSDPITTSLKMWNKINSFIIIIAFPVTLEKLNKNPQACPPLPPPQKNFLHTLIFSPPTQKLAVRSLHQSVRRKVPLITTVFWCWHVLKLKLIWNGMKYEMENKYESAQIVSQWVMGAKAQAIPAIPSKKIVTPKHLRTPLPRVNVHCGKTLRIPGKHRCLWNIEIWKGWSATQHEGSAAVYFCLRLWLA